jgi:hypothetical protein
MKSPSHVNMKSASSSATHQRDHALAVEAGEHSTLTTSITKSALHVTPHSSDDHHAMLADAAYRRAEQRGFEPGHELDDWLAAEMELEQRLAGEGRAY